MLAVAHAEMFNDVVPMDVNFWKWKERHCFDKQTLTVLNIVDAASGTHLAPRIPYQTTHTLWKTFARLASLGWCADMSQSGSSSCTDQLGIL